MSIIRSSFQEARIPFEKMSYTPDVPSTNLGANEYNLGLNVETDVRGIRSVSGDQQIFNQIPANYEPMFITGGFRRNGEWWFVIGCVGADGSGMTTPGKWFAASATQTWYDITPTNIDTSQYAQNQNVTETWNGTVLLINDSFNPPFFWLDEDPVLYPTATAKMIAYSNTVPLEISDIQPVTTTTRKITFADTTLGLAPFTVGDQVTLSNVNPVAYNSSNATSGNYTFYTVTACTTTDVTISCSVTATYIPNQGGGVVAPRYSWNYNSDWTKVHAGFMRLYQTPNVGSILVAGNLTATPRVNPTDIQNYPVTVQWSQSFGLNQVPITWVPTATNVANQLEVPLRGPCIDAFPCNGQFFLCSYWDVVVFSPLNYSTTSAPIIGVKLMNQGRGLLTANCWANTDKLVYGIDARDVWAFDGQNFVGIGNQRVRNWFFDQIDPVFYDRIHMQCNTQKNQIEIYYPDRNATFGRPNKMLAYRYDLDVWNPPRDVYAATFATEAPVFGRVRQYFFLSATNITGSGTGAKFNVRLDDSTYTLVQVASPDVGTGYAIGNTMKILGTALGGATPANDVTITVTGVSSGAITAISWTGTAAGYDSPNYASRCITYIPGFTQVKMLQKDQGYNFVIQNAVTPITSFFRRDNIKLLKDYSGKLLVHRLLPETINLDSMGVPVYPSTGSVNIRVEGANSVGQAPQAATDITVNINADQPWAQMNQNAYRVNAIQVGNTSQTNIWMLNATTWQFTQTEDDR